MVRKPRRHDRPGRLWRPAPWGAYALAIGLAVAVMLVRATPNLGGALGWGALNWILVLALVTSAAAWACGPGPGLVATAVATLYAVWALVLPLRLSLGSFERIIALGLLLFAGVVASLVSAGRR